jgi:hypothetical protein
LLWARAPARPRYLDRLVIDPGSGAPVRGLPHQLRALGHDPLGAPVRLAALSWHTSDTLVAALDSTGLLTPRRAGRTTITVSAGGWRTATHTVTVRDAPRRTVFVEDWRRGLDAEWVPYGEPRPAVVCAPDGSPAFWNGNDGRYTSGAYSRRTYTAADGLGVEVRLSTPVTLQQWQEQMVGLFFGVDSSVLATWNHRTGYPPFHRGTFVRDCTMIYPGGGEGYTYADSIAMSGGAKVTAPAALRTGRWFTVRLQVFPDGRCGLALDGRPVALGPRQPTPGTRAHLVLDGKSFETRLLVGPLTVFTGVPDDIDWTELYARGAVAVPPPATPSTRATATR